MRKRRGPYEGFIYLTLILYIFFLIKSLPKNSSPKPERWEKIYVDISSTVYEFNKDITLGQIFGIASDYPVKNGSKIEVKRTGNSLNLYISKMDASKLLTLSIPINLNGASLEDLVTIPQIGETLARRILEYRKNNNGFKNIMELLNIKGIGYKKYEKIKEYLSVE